jgi:alpha-beta hydrolase superfamily lysophospholipase
VTLRIDRFAATVPKQGTLLCLHAMMTDGRYFKGGFARELAARGWDVCVGDFRGHGGSRPPDAGKDDWSFDDLVDFDLPAMIAATRPDAILGHSLGGLVACAALGTGRIPRPRTLILAATSVWLGETLRRRALMAAYRAITRIAGKAPVRALRAGNADESRGYVEQLTGWARTGRWTSARGIDYRAALANIDAPAHAFCGGADWMCRPADANAIAQRIATCSPLEVVPGADHFSLFRKCADLVAKKLCH